MGVGLNADAGLIPDPEKFLELFDEEFRSLQAGVSAGTSSVSSQPDLDKTALDA